MVTWCLATWLVIFEYMWDSWGRLPTNKQIIDYSKNTYIHKWKHNKKIPLWIQGVHWCPPIL